MYSSLETTYKNHMVIYWANLSRTNNLLIILNVTLFFLTGLVSKGYYYTFYSIGCFSIVSILTMIPLGVIARLWFYLLNLILEFSGIYFLTASVVYWIRHGAPIGH